MTQRRFKDATTDFDQVQKWWTHAPHANLGIQTGKVSRLVVLDVDPRHGVFKVPWISGRSSGDGTACLEYKSVQSSP